MNKYIFISTNSAGQSKLTPKYVLTAYGLTQKETESAIRLSFCTKNTVDESDGFVFELSNAVKRFR